jgi:hypothetical protein
MAAAILRHGRPHQASDRAPHRGAGTGDPLNYGVARKLLEFIPFSEMRVIPHLSAFSLAAARLGWSLPDCDTLTLHGRDAANIEPFIQPGARLIVLTADATTIAEVARRLVARGFGKSTITVLENMGGPRERIASFAADSPPQQDFSDLNTIGIACTVSPGAKIYSRLAGLPDDAFVHDGQLTKREVRAATLAATAPAPDQLLWMPAPAAFHRYRVDARNAQLRGNRLRGNVGGLNDSANADDHRRAPQDRRIAGILCNQPAPMPCSLAAASAFQRV